MEAEAAVVVGCGWRGSGRENTETLWKTPSRKAMTEPSTPLNGRPSASCTSLFSKSSAGGQFGSVVPPLPLQAGWRCSQSLGASAGGSELAFHPSEVEVATVATAASNERITRTAVVDSLRVATRPLDPAMAASVQSAALSQLQPDARGMVAPQEVARVWLMTVLPALERAPLRAPSGEPVTRRLTERLHRLLGTRLSQVMLDELPRAQEALGLSADAAGGGALPSGLVHPFVATLVTAALSATVRELGDSLLALPGIESAAGALRQGGAGTGAGGGPSQADAVGAAEALVRRMLEGALHGHHAALAQAAYAEEAAAAGGESGAQDAAGSGTSGVPSARELLRVREVQAALVELRSEHAALTAEHSAVLGDHEALLVAHRKLDAELEGTQAALGQLREEHARLLEEHAAMHEAASSEAAALEEQLLAARASADAEASATAVAQRRGEHWAAEAAALERERTALLGRVAAAEAAAAAAAEHAANAAATVAADHRPTAGATACVAHGAPVATTTASLHEDEEYKDDAPATSAIVHAAAASPHATAVSPRASFGSGAASPSTATGDVGEDDEGENDEAALMAAAGIRVTMAKAKSAGSAGAPGGIQHGLGSPSRSTLSLRAPSLAPIREVDLLDQEERPTGCGIPERPRRATYTDHDGSGYAGPTYVTRNELRL